ncbi:MAG: ATP-binding protein, partial [Pseudomonadota bacterium]
GLKEGDAALRVAEDRDAGEPREGRFATPLMDLAREASYKNAPREETEAAIEQIQALAKLKPEADAARAAISECFEGLDALPAVKAFAALAELEKNRDALPAFAPALRALSGAPEAVRSALRTLDLTIDGIEAAVLDRAVERAMVVRPALREMTGFSVDETSAKIADAMSAFRKANAKALLLETQARFARAVRASAIGGKRAGLGGDLFEDAAQAPSAEDLAKREAYAKGRAALEKSNRNATLRDLMSGDAGPVIADLKPVWLMSPLSVADVLPLAGDLFDVAIFDEASQVSVEDAAPTLFRAPQVIVVGDEKQLPPTNFFGSGPSVDADEIDPDDAADELDLRAESFLGQAAKSLPSTLLGWHYRSRSEALIAFSNAVFYGGKLISVPSVRRLVEAPAVEAQDASEGKTFWREVVARPVSFHHTPFGVYESQRNGGEAAYIAEMVRGLLLAKPSEGGGQTIGVVAFSEAQQSEIERALEDLAKIDAKFAAAYEKELEREEDG